MGKTKLVYKDDKTVKVLWGKIENEDTIFITFLTGDGNVFRINKNHVISIKEVSD